MDDSRSAYSNARLSGCHYFIPKRKFIFCIRHIFCSERHITGRDRRLALPPAVWTESGDVAVSDYVFAFRPRGAGLGVFVSTVLGSALEIDGESNSALRLTDAIPPSPLSPAQTTTKRPTWPSKVR